MTVDIASLQHEAAKTPPIDLQGLRQAVAAVLARPVGAAAYDQLMQAYQAFIASSTPEHLYRRLQHARHLWLREDSSTPLRIRPLNPKDDPHAPHLEDAAPLGG